MDSGRLRSAVPSVSASEGGENVGTAVRYYSRLAVAAVELPPGAKIKLGDALAFDRPHHRRPFAVTVGSMQLNRQPIEEAVGPCVVGIEVGQWVKPNSPVRRA